MVLIFTIFNKSIKVYSKFKLLLVLLIFFSSHILLTSLSETICEESYEVAKTKVQVNEKSVSDISSGNGINITNKQSEAVAGSVSTNLDSARYCAAIAVTGNDRAGSLNQRVRETKQVFGYLRDNPLGAGIGGAKKLLKSSISVGYADAAANAGILGGVFYLVSFAVLSFLAIKVLVHNDFIKKNYENIIDKKILVALAASVFTLAFTGLLREQPDSSYWHFWIYASFIIVISQVKLKQVGNENI